MTDAHKAHSVEMSQKNSNRDRLFMIDTKDQTMNNKLKQSLFIISEDIVDINPSIEKETCQHSNAKLGPLFHIDSKI